MSGWTTAALVAALAAAPAGAQQAVPARGDVPAIVTRGLEAYQARGLGAALDVWLAGSPVASDPSTKAQMVGGLAPLESAYGRVVGADMVGVVSIGQHVRRVYAVIRLERGPLYAFFECYQTAGGAWIIPGLLFNAKAQDIFPPRYLGG